MTVLLDRPAARHTRRRQFALLACTILLASCGGDDRDDKADTPSPQNVTIEGDRTSGDRVKASTKGIVERPRTVSIRVSAAPKQRVDVSWGLSCPRTADDRDAKPVGGTYSTTPPNVRTLRLPSRDSAFCAVNAQMQLSRSGRAKIAVLGSGRPPG